MRPRALAVCGIYLFSLCACSPRLLAVRTTASVMERGAPAVYSEPDPILAEQALASQLELLREFLANDPDNPRLLTLAAQSFAGYAFLFLEGKDDARARAFYKRGMDYGMRLLHERLPCLASASDDAAVAACFQRLKRRDADALFWTAYGWAGWVNLGRDDPDATADLPRVEAAMARVEQLDPGHFYAGPDLFFGADYGSRSKTLGGRPEESKARFDLALKREGGKFLCAQFLYARYYAVQAQDKPLFESLLHQIQDAPADILPEQRLANEVAKRKAGELLKHEGELFE